MSARTRLAVSLSAMAAAASMAAAGSAQAAMCTTAAQVVKNRQHISCARSVLVADAARVAIPGIPECRGQTARWNGWSIRGTGSNGPVAAQFTKGRRSFRVVGGGWCG